MSRFKLLLDESNLTQNVRVELEPNCKELKRKKIIKDKEDVIADYLKYLFSHAKDELVNGHDFSGARPVEFVLCVPPMWTPKASKIMQKNMERAIRETGFGRVKNNSVDNLFIVSEPEAAAAYVLASTTAVLVCLKSLRVSNFNNTDNCSLRRRLCLLMLVEVLLTP